MIHTVQLADKYWGEAVQTAIYLRNRCPTLALVNKTPYETWYGSKPNISHLRTFGCIPYIYIPKRKEESLTLRAESEYFFGMLKQVGEVSIKYMMKDQEPSTQLVMLYALNRG